jgi:hypothetical protein
MLHKFQRKPEAFNKSRLQGFCSMPLLSTTVTRTRLQLPQ